MACSVSRAQSRPRNAHVPSPTSGILNPLISIACVTLSAFRIIDEAKQKQCATPGLTRLARGNHRICHGTFEIVVEKPAGLVARRDPGLLHLTHFEFLRVVELFTEPSEAVVEDVVP